MKLLNFMETVVRTHKKCYKTFNKNKTYYSTNFSMIIGRDGVDIIRNEIEPGKWAAHSVFIMNTVNMKVQHRNNANALPYGGSSFFRVSSEEEFQVQDTNGAVQVLALPRYNDNEDELLFTLDTVTDCSMSIVLAAILMTLDTKLTTMYTYRISENDLDEIVELLEMVHGTHQVQ